LGKDSTSVVEWSNLDKDKRLILQTEIIKSLNRGEEITASEIYRILNEYKENE
jgi:hypothetical protein